MLCSACSELEHGLIGKLLAPQELAMQRTRGVEGANALGVDNIYTYRSTVVTKHQGDGWKARRIAPNASSAPQVCPQSPTATLGTKQAKREAATQDLRAQNAVLELNAWKDSGRSDVRLKN